jgi:predicted glycoside hydrolase/deacetylase ChbG (UPF0249 family)
MKQRLTLLLLSLGIFSTIGCAQKGDIYLIVRADDIGITHTVNQACMDVFTDGVARSVEIIVPAPWFEEAVTLLMENPGYDVGVHLTLTSEWQYLKWRPLTYAPSLTDKNGYFHPFIWKNDVPGATFLKESDWKLDEIEAELRAQIELAKARIPHISHYSTHMGFGQADPQITSLVKTLADEYAIDIDLGNMDVKSMKGFGGSSLTAEEKITNFLANLESLTPGLWLFVDHPGYDTSEMKGVGHVGYENVGFDRDGVTKAWTDPQVKEIISKKGIQLISYSRAKEIFQR